MYDTELMAAILATLPRERQPGEGVTAREIADSSPYTENTVRRHLNDSGLEAIDMRDFDGIVRIVFVKSKI